MCLCVYVCMFVGVCCVVLFLWCCCKSMIIKKHLFIQCHTYISRVYVIHSNTVLYTYSYTFGYMFFYVMFKIYFIHEFIILSGSVNLLMFDFSSFYSMIFLVFYSKRINNHTIKKRMKHDLEKLNDLI